MSSEASRINDKEMGEERRELCCLLQSTAATLTLAETFEIEMENRERMSLSLAGAGAGAGRQVRRDERQRFTVRRRVHGKTSSVSTRATAWLLSCHD